MAWTAPRTWAAGEVVTASLMNTHVRDNLKAIATVSGSTVPVGGYHTGGETISYGVTFSVAPFIMVQLGDTVKCVVTTSDQTTTDCKVHLYDSATGAELTATTAVRISWLAQGNFS